MHYHPIAKTLHWLTAAAIVLQFVLAEWAEHAQEENLALKQLALLAHHKSVGMTILLLAALRLLWRAFNSPPELPAQMSAWQVRASHISHGALYLLLVLLPISGWLMSSASAYTVSWFNLFQFPDLVSADESLKTTLLTVHDTLAKALFVLALIHIAAAFKHFWKDRDDILQRMSSATSISLFLATVVAGIWWLGPSESVTQTPSEAVPTTATPVSEKLTQEIVNSSLASWQIDYANSHIEFVGEQAGAEFSGRWQQWQADVRFDPAALAQTQVTVQVNTATPQTGDNDRDQTMQGSDWFDSAQFPHAVFSTQQVVADGTEFVANGTLQIKALSIPVVFTFTLQQQGANRVLDGSAGLDRLALALGTGEWSDPTWVGQTVFVSVHVEAIAAEVTPPQ